MTEKNYAAPALEKGFDIIELLAEVPAGLTISEMAARLGRTISEIFRIAVVMDRRGWLDRDPENDRYRVSYHVLELAHRATPAQELTSAAGPVMQALAREIEQSCHLVVPNGERGLVVLREQSPDDTGFAIRLGAAIDLRTSCSGHVILAFAKGAVLGEADPLRPAIETVRRRGYEKVPSAKTRGVTDLSCPVFGFSGDMIAALTVPFLTPMDETQHVPIDTALVRLQDAARRISRALGWYDRDNLPTEPILSVPARAKAKRTRKPD